jgi:hypothetical protein
MTRPLTKLEFARLAISLGTESNERVSVTQFLLANAMRGTAIGVAFAALMLLTDTLGIFTLVMSQPAPITTALIFVLICCFKFIPTTVAVALAVAARSQ